MDIIKRREGIRDHNNSQTEDTLEYDSYLETSHNYSEPEEETLQDDSYLESSPKVHHVMEKPYKIKYGCCSCKMLLIHSTILLCIVGYTFLNKTNNSCDFSDLSTKYKLSKNSANFINSLHAIVNDMLIMGNPSTLGVFLFLHDGSEKMKEVVDVISERVSSCFASPTNAVSLPIEEFKSKQALSDYGYIIQNFFKILKRGRVVKIANLNEIPTETVMALHFICDTYSPPEPNVIILLSLVTERVKLTGSKDVREKLEKLWPTLKTDELDPLINRLTNIVIPLTLRI